MTSLQDNQHWTLLLDFSNAFNSISREAMFVECRRRLPGLSAWMESCYSCHPLLHLGKDVVHSWLRCAAGGSSGSTGVLPNSSSHRRAYQGRGSLPRFECLVPQRWNPSGPPRGSLGCTDINRSKSLLVVPSQCDSSNSSLPSDIPVTRGGLSPRLPHQSNPLL